MTTLFLNFLSIATLFSGVLTITAKNPVISVIYLIFTFVFAAGYLILIGIQFIGISYIIVYVGAIAVLFLFVIMMINIKLTEILETGNQYTKNLPIAISIGSLFLYLIYNLIPFNFNNISTIFLLARSQINILNYYNNLDLSGNYEKLDPVLLEQINNNTVDYIEIDESFFSNENFSINFDVLDFKTLSEKFKNLNLSESEVTQLINNNSNNDYFIFNFLQIEVLGHTLYTYGAILLIILSFILLLAMFATIVITKK